MINFTVNKEMILKTVEKKLPLREELKVKGQVPENLKFVEKYISKNPVAEIVKVDVDFKEGYILATIDGELELGESIYTFKVYVEGTPKYKKEKFYFKASKIKVVPEKDFSIIIKNFIVEETKKVKVLGAVTSFLSKAHDKFGPKDGDIKDSKINKIIEDKIQEESVKFLKETPIYELEDDSLKEKAIKKCLDDIVITKDGIKIKTKSIL